jgi:hypothetical protein
MNSADLIEVFRKDFADDVNPSKYRWGDEFLLRSFNEAQKQVCNRVDCIFHNNQFITLANGKAHYTLPTNLNRLLALTLNGLELTKVLPEQLRYDWRTQAGFNADPERCFIIRGNIITFTPTPATADSGSKVYVEGFWQPETLTSLQDELEIPLEYQRDSVHWVLYEAYSNDDVDQKDELKSQTNLAQFNQTFGKPVPSNVRQYQFETNMS